MSLKCAVIVCVAAAIAVPMMAESPGADTFRTRCAMCHGVDGKADTPAGKAFKAASLTDPMVTTKSDDELLVIIRNGKNKMPAWKDKLTEEQMKAVLGYIRALPN